MFNEKRGYKFERLQMKDTQLKMGVQGLGMGAWEQTPVYGYLVGLLG